MERILETSNYKFAFFFNSTTTETFWPKFNFQLIIFVNFPKNTQVHTCTYLENIETMLCINKSVSSNFPGIYMYIHTITKTCIHLILQLFVREFLIVENIRQVGQQDPTADFGIETNAKLTPDCQLREIAKLVVF